MQWVLIQKEFHLTNLERMIEKGHNFEIPKKIMDSVRIINGCREGNGTPLQYSCLENPMNGGAW